MGMEVYALLSVMVICFGIYIFYAYFSMKKGGPVNNSLLAGKECSEGKCKNEEAYRARTLPAVLILAIVTTCFGIIDMINYLVQRLGIWHKLALAVFFIVLLWYMVYTSKAKRIYFDI